MRGRERERFIRATSKRRSTLANRPRAERTRTCSLNGNFFIFAMVGGAASPSVLRISKNSTSSGSPSITKYLTSRILASTAALIPSGVISEV